MIEQGLTLMAMGMGTVFSFLVVLIFAMIITHKCLSVINTFFPETVIETVSPKKAKATNNDEEIAVALAATKAL